MRTFACTDRGRHLLRHDKAKYLRVATTSETSLPHHNLGTPILGGRLRIGPSKPGIGRHLDCGTNMEPMRRPRLEEQSPLLESKALPVRFAAATLSTAVTLGLVWKFEWAWNWCYSGAAVLSQFLIYDQARQNRSFPSTRPWMTLVTFNLIYAITSTSWLQFYAFTAICWTAVLFTFVTVAPGASSVTRTIFRPLFSQAHLAKDVIAGFDLPALYLDIGLEGMLTVRGWTFSLSTMSLELHGVEAGSLHICSRTSTPH